MLASMEDTNLSAALIAILNLAGAIPILNEGVSRTENASRIS